MKEQDLISLGFKRYDVTAEESGDEAFYYYTMDFGNGSWSLISPASNEIKKGKWYVEAFEDKNIRFTKSNHLKTIINAINKSINEKK